MSWEDVLDEIEGRLARVEEGLGTGRLDVSGFGLPEGLGALPAELRPRAQRALAKGRVLEIELEALRKRTVAALSRGRSAPRTPAVYVDRRV